MPSSAKRGPSCVGTGFIVLDIIRREIEQNVTLERRYAGGSCGNVLAILSYLGVSSHAVGRIGDDAAGRELLADLRQWKVGVAQLIAEVNRRTPMVLQESYVDARGRARHRFSRACPMCGASMPGYRPVLVSEVDALVKAIPDHDLFFFDRVSPGNLELARHSREQGALVFFEPSGIKDEDLFVECLRASHVLKYSHERLSGIDALLKGASVLLEIDTHGAEGLRLRTRKAGRLGAWHKLSAFAAPQVVDTVGSGDWCTAGLLSKLAESGKARDEVADIDAITGHVRYGQALAALNCGYEGARGLMYAASRAAVTKAAAHLLAEGVVNLPEATVAAQDSSSRSCVVCTSAVHA